MYEQFTAQFEDSLKPVSELMKINVKTAETLAQQHTSFFTAALNDSLAYTQSLMAQKDLAGFLNINKEFGEDLQGKIVDVTKEAYATITEAQDATSELFKGAFVKAQEAAAEIAPKVPVAKKTAK
ncbi:MAG: phasin family protein [Pseudomonadales bacterium]